MLPVIVALVVGSVYAVLTLHRCLVGTSIKSVNITQSSWLSSLWRTLTSSQSENAGLYQIHAMVRTVLLLLTFVYLPVTQSVLEFFNCAEQAGGKYRIRTRPDIVCYEGSHASYLPIAIVFGLLIEVAGLPLGIFAWMYRHRVSKKRGDLATYNMVGFAPVRNCIDK